MSKPKPNGDIGILVNGASEQSIKEARLSIADILKADVDESTKKHALTALTTLCQVNTNISNCTITTKGAN